MFDFYTDNLNSIKSNFYYEKYFCIKKEKTLTDNIIDDMIDAMDERPNSYKSEYISSVTDNNVFIDIYFGFIVNLKMNIPNCKIKHTSFYDKPTNADEESEIDNDEYENFTYNTLEEYHSYKKDNNEKLYFKHNLGVIISNNNVFNGQLAFINKNNYFFIDDCKRSLHKFYFRNTMNWGDKSICKLFDGDEKIYTFEYPSFNKTQIRFFTHSFFNCQKYKVKLFKNNHLNTLQDMVVSNKKLLMDILNEQDKSLTRFKTYTNDCFNSMINNLQRKNNFIQSLKFTNENNS